VSVLDECVDHRLGVLARHSDQHHIARVALHQRRDLAIVATEQQVTFPVARYGSIRSLSRTLPDRYRVRDLAQPLVFERLESKNDCVRTNERSRSGTRPLTNDRKSSDGQIHCSKSWLDNPSATPPALVIESRCCNDRLKSQPKADGHFFLKEEIRVASIGKSGHSLSDTFNRTNCH